MGEADVVDWRPSECEVAWLDGLHLPLGKGQVSDFSPFLLKAASSESLGVRSFGRVHIRNPQL